MVNLKDVAKKAGVSLATASYALNGNEKIKKETREKIVKVAEELGYVPNALARGLIAQKTKTIGLIVTDIAIPFLSTLVQHIEKDLRGRGYNLLLGTSEDDPEIEKKLIEDFRERRIDGLIISPGSESINLDDKDLDTSHIYNLKKNNIPFIFINEFYPDLKANYVVTDLEEGTYKLTNYLLDDGHRRIVFFVGKLKHYVSTMRYRGYKRSFRDAGIEPSENIIVECGGYSFKEAYLEAVNWLQNNDLPDVFMASNDAMAIGILKALREADISVPDDVALVGYDDVIYPTMAEISLTTVKTPIKDISSRAVDILISNIEGESRSLQQILLEPELVIRDST